MPVSYSGPPTAEGMQAHTTPNLKIFMLNFL